MRTVCETVYLFDELSDEAKENAIERTRNSGHYLDWDWWDFTYEDAKNICAQLGIDIDNIGFSGFCSQGDGAHFTGKYEFNPGAEKALRLYLWGDDLEFFLPIARALKEIQSRYYGQLTATVKHSGYYSHEYCTDFEFDIDLYEIPEEVDEETRDNLYVLPEDEARIKELFRSIMKWIYRRLGSEYEYHMEDEQVAEHLIANEAEFLENGRPYAGF